MCSTATRILSRNAGVLDRAGGQGIMSWNPTHLVAVLSQLYNLVVVPKFTSVSTGLAITPTSGTGAMTVRPCTPKEGNEREDDSRH